MAQSTLGLRFYEVMHKNAESVVVAITGEQELVHSSLAASYVYRPDLVAV